MDASRSLVGTAQKKENLLSYSTPDYGNGVGMSAALTKDAYLVVVVPCYNEEASLPHFVAAWSEVEKDIARFFPLTEYVFVNDGSADGTLPVLRKLRQANERFHYTSFSRNFGKEAGLIAGLQRALDLGATHVVVMDADLQDPPTLMPQMCQEMKDSGCDVVATYRRTREGEPPVRSWFAHRFYSLMNSHSDVQMRDGARDFRLMTRRVVQVICSLPERERFSKGIFAWVGFDTRWIGYDNVEREWGSTSWSFWSLVRYALDGIVAFSTAPLEVVSVAGLVIFLLSIIFLIFIVVRKLIFGDPVAGWASLVCIVSFFSGASLLAQGVVGLYIAKIYTETKNRPYYIVAEEDGNTDVADRH